MPCKFEPWPRLRGWLRRPRRRPFLRRLVAALATQAVHRSTPAAAEQSLLLKAANIVPHGGGKKLDPKSDGFKTVARWIGEGMSFGKDSDAKLVSIEVQPKQGSMKVKSQ